MKYSIVMSVYFNDRPEWLIEAMESLVNQTVPSDDILIVADGPLPKEVNAVLSNFVDEETIRLIRLEENMGLGYALNAGIKNAKHDLVARMDSDDIAVPNRFELQLAAFIENPELDILGGQISEFIGDPSKVVAHRKVPTSQLEIEKFARRRNPFNHPTVIFKKTFIERVGCYDASVIRLEDYDLWLRALSSGAICANLDSTLLKYRLTNDSIKRRKTLSSWKNHIKARTKFYGKQYISLTDLVYGVTTQTTLFVMPTVVANMIFRKVVRNAKS